LLRMLQDHGVRNEIRLLARGEGLIGVSIVTVLSLADLCIPRVARRVG
jgi:hypothetical protein